MTCTFQIIKSDNAWKTTILGKEKKRGKSTVIAINGYLKLIKIVILKGFLCIALSIERKCSAQSFSMCS